MKRFFAIFLFLMMITSLQMPVSAQESYSLTAGELCVTINGNPVTGTELISATDKIRLVVDDEEICIIGANGKYYEVNKDFCVTEDTDFTDAVLYKLGLDMVNGAQVRVGTLELDENGKMDAAADSGLRFIATANYNDTIIAKEGIEFGIKVTAEGSENPLYIKAEKFQSDDKSIFTAAITNLSENNYNRKYTACTYARVPLYDKTVKEFNSGEVRRSIYQVSVGIMKHNTGKSESGLPDTVDETVKNVLNAYINQTGIRLTYKNDGTAHAREEGTGSYTGDVFFDVQSYLNDDNSTTVTVTPYGEAKGFGTEVTIASWWDEYLRINNNHSTVTGYISNAELSGNVLTFNFKIPGFVPYSFDVEDSVVVVSSVTENKITGFKEGEEVSYDFAESVSVVGLSNNIDDVTSGSVVMVGTDKAGNCAAIELLATLGMPVDSETFEKNIGVYDPSDGSGKYQNIVAELNSKSGILITTRNPDDNTKTPYTFESANTMCYRVGIAIDNGTPLISCTGKKVSSYPSIFENTAYYHNYVYLRYNTETQKVTQCVYYCVPKNLDFTGDGEYSDIFSADSYRIIIK